MVFIDVPDVVWEVDDLRTERRVEHGAWSMENRFSRDVGHRACRDVASRHVRNKNDDYE